MAFLPCRAPVRPRPRILERVIIRSYSDSQAVSRIVSQKRGAALEEVSDVPAGNILTGPLLPCVRTVPELLPGNTCKTRTRKNITLEEPLSGMSDLKPLRIDPVIHNGRLEVWKSFNRDPFGSFTG